MIPALIAADRSDNTNVDTQQYVVDAAILYKAGHTLFYTRYGGATTIRCVLSVHIILSAALLSHCCECMCCLLLLCSLCAIDNGPPGWFGNQRSVQAERHCQGCVCHLHASLCVLAVSSQHLQIKTIYQPLVYCDLFWCSPTTKAVCVVC